MTNEIMIFNNEEFGNIRTILIDDEPWFVAKDVAKALGYKDAINAIKYHVEDMNKIVGRSGSTPPIEDNLGRIQYPTWVNEAGMIL